MNAIERLMNGAIDMHVHFGPESLVERRENAWQLAQTARDLKMRAIVLKNREYTTVPMAYIVNQMVPDFQLFGSLTLDNESGGLNPSAVVSSVKMGAKVIWMPVFTSSNSKPNAEKIMGIKLPGGTLDCLDANGKLKAEVKEILQIVKEFDVVLATGHIAPNEIFALCEESQRVGFKKLVVTHALQAILMLQKLTPQQMRELALGGATIEQSFWEWMPTLAVKDPQDIVDVIRLVGPEHTIMSSDMGQAYNPPAPEGMRLYIATLLRKGLQESEIELMVKTNPARLLNLA
jgi:hypothetical protein